MAKNVTIGQKYHYWPTNRLLTTAVCWRGEGSRAVCRGLILPLGEHNTSAHNNNDDDDDDDNDDDDDDKSSHRYIINGCVVL